jgi:hypothetical protein
MHISWSLSQDSGGCGNGFRPGKGIMYLRSYYLLSQIYDVVDFFQNIYSKM